MPHKIVVGITEWSLMLLLFQSVSSLQWNPHGGLVQLVSRNGCNPEILSSWSSVTVWDHSRKPRYYEGWKIVLLLSILRNPGAVSRARRSFRSGKIVNIRLADFARSVTNISEDVYYPFRPRFNYRRFSSGFMMNFLFYFEWPSK